MSVAEVSPPLELDLPRTWRGWWLAWPKWFRIGGYAFAGLAVLHVALAVRIYVGLQEPAEMTAMRKRLIEFRFFWQTRDKWDYQFTAPEHLSWDQKILSGLYGHSWRNVEEIDMSHRGTDDDLKFLTAHCPNLRFLTAESTDITPSAVKTLKNCRQLSELNLNDTDTDDTAVIELRHLKHLSMLKLRETLVGDNTVYHALFDMPSLKGVDLQETDVTFESLNEWDRVRPYNRTPVIAVTETVPGQETIRATIRWIDGTRSGRFEGAPSSIRFTGPPSQFGSEAQWMESSAFSRKDLFFKRTNTGFPVHGEYRFTLRIGDYEAKPILLNDPSTSVWPERIEFEMPCTKAEALASAKE